jgi:hypothetical protein
MQIQTLKTIYLPSEKSPNGYEIIRFVKRDADSKIFVGIGDEEWIIKHGLSIDQYTNLNNEA